MRRPPLLSILLFFCLASACSGAKVDSVPPPPEYLTAAAASHIPTDTATPQPPTAISSPLQPTLPPTISPPPPGEGAGGEGGPTPTITPLALPSQTPLREWNGIPIMSGAIAGVEEEQGYLFTTYIAVKKVQKFYFQTLGSLGWEVQATGTKDGALVIAHKEGQLLSIAIGPHDSGVTVVRMTIE